jgi:hypothetical protein
VRAGLAPRVRAARIVARQRLTTATGSGGAIRPNTTREAGTSDAASRREARSTQIEAGGLLAAALLLVVLAQHSLLAAALSIAAGVLAGLAIRRARTRHSGHGRALGSRICARCVRSDGSAWSPPATC